MNTLNPEIRKPVAGRRHARYSDEFKRQVVGACQTPGISMAAIARANSVNANMLRRWVVESSQSSDDQLGAIKKPMQSAPASPDFIPVKFAPALPVQSPDIRIEIQHASAAIQIHWPVAASSQCAQWLREVLA